MPSRECAHCGELVFEDPRSGPGVCPSCGEVLESEPEPELGADDPMDRKRTIRFRRPPTLRRG